MELEEAFGKLQLLHHAVMWTSRRDGSPQLSPVVCLIDDDNRLVVSSRETAMKVRNLRRDQRVSLCVFSDAFFGEWLQVSGRADIVELPEAMDGLIGYYRTLSGEHPDWDEYKTAMVDEKRVLVRIEIERAGPDRQG